MPTLSDILSILSAKISTLEGGISARSAGSISTRGFQSIIKALSNRMSLDTASVDNRATSLAQAVSGVSQQISVLSQAHSALSDKVVSISAQIVSVDGRATSLANAVSVVSQQISVISQGLSALSDKVVS